MEEGRSKRKHSMSWKRKGVLYTAIFYLALIYPDTNHYNRIWSAAVFQSFTMQPKLLFSRPKWPCHSYWLKSPLASLCLQNEVQTPWNCPSPTHSLNFPNTLVFSASLEQHKHFHYFLLLHLLFSVSETVFLHLTIPGKSFTGFYKQSHMTSPYFLLWSFPRQSLIFVFQQYLGSISAKSTDEYLP